MPNTLRKIITAQSQSIDEYVPAIPARPAQAARLVTETRVICGLRYPAGAATYSYVYDYAAGRVVLVAKPVSTGGLGGSITGTYSCKEERVQIRYPAVPAQAYVPGYNIKKKQVGPDFNVGYNAGARSVDDFYDDGEVGFKATVLTVSAIAGIDQPDGIEGYPGYNIDFAFKMERGVWSIFSHGDKPAGSPTGAYTDATAFSIQRASGFVLWKIDGDTVWTSSAGVASGRAWLAASLYAGGDSLTDPYIDQQGLPALPEHVGTINLALPPLAMRLADPGAAARTELSLALPAPRMDLVAGKVPPPPFNVLSLVIPLAFEFQGRQNPYGTLNLAIPLAMRLGNGQTDLYLRLPPLTTALEATSVAPSGPLQAFAPFLFDVSMSAEGGTDEEEPLDARESFYFEVFMGADDVPPPEPGGPLDARVRFIFDVPMLANAGGKVADARTRFVFNVPMSAQQQQTADARTFFRFDVAMSLPGANLETHAINLDGYGSTSYSGYAFNSYAQLGDDYFGAGEQGLMRLGGNTDAGAKVRAIVSPGRMDFGSTQNKTVIEIWVGVQSRRALAMKAVIEGEEYVYEADSFNGEELELHRIKLGKGNTSNFITPVFYNQDGEDFELEGIEFAVANLSRKR